MERSRDELKTERYSERVRADFFAEVQNGVYGTPGVFLNGVHYDGKWEQTIAKEPSDVVIALRSISARLH